MYHSKETTFDGFVVRSFFDDQYRKDCGGIICDVCDSLEDVADAIIEYLKERIQDDTDCEPLSRDAWLRVRTQIIENAKPPVWSFKPRLFEELAQVNSPDSIKINQVRLSRRLVERIQKQ